MDPLTFVSPLVLFLALVFGHCLADYPLQGDFMARAKNHRAPVAGVPSVLLLATHAFIHAGVVAFLTGNLLCGACEFVLHAAIDHAKSELSDSAHPSALFALDQLLHVLCKGLWVALAIRYADVA